MYLGVRVDLTENKQEKTSEKNQPKKYQWFDLRKSKIFLAPEMLCGQPCVLLIDSSGVFKRHINLVGKLEENGFQAIDFEFYTGIAKLYVKFTNEISADFFKKNLSIPSQDINIFEATRQDIQNIFYHYAKQTFAMRIDILVKSSVYLGLNHKSGKTYSSPFGRYTVTVDSNENESYENEFLEYTRNPKYLRATSTEDVKTCCIGLFETVIKEKQNLTLNDVIDFASIIYQVGNKKNDSVQPHQIINVLSCYQTIFNKRTPDIVLGTNSTMDVLTGYSFFRESVLLHESSPAQPKAIYTTYLANQHVTPLPLAMVMQRILISNAQTKSTASKVFYPMAGDGILACFLSRTWLNFVVMENNLSKFKLLSQNSSFSAIHADCVNFNLSESNDTNSFEYVISSLACYRHHSFSTFTCGSKKISVNRADLLTILKTLMCRSGEGRSVFLLQYFYDSGIDFQSSQEAEISDVLNFIASFYKVDGVTISSDIYSKSITQINPIMLIIGERLKETVDAKDVLTRLKQTVIQTYEDLWAWSSQFEYLATEDYKTDIKLRDVVSKDIKLALQIRKPKPLAVQNTSTVKAVKTTQSTKTNEQDDGLDAFGGSVADEAVVDQKNESISGMHAKFAMSLSENSPANTQDKDNTEDAKNTANAGDAANTGEAANTGDTVNTANVGDAVNTGNTVNTANTANTVNTGDAENTGNTENSGGDAHNTGEDVATQNTSKAEAETNEKPKDANDSAAKKTSEIDSEIEKQRSIIKKEISELSEKLKSTSKITNNKKNILDISKRNEVIRFHSLSTFLEPKSNVYQLDFEDYLTGKRNLQSFIGDAYGLSTVNSPKKKDLMQYLDKHKLQPSVDSFIGDVLELDHPLTFTPYYRAEHLDFITACIQRFYLNKSTLLIDSPGLDVHTPLATMFFFFCLNQRNTFYVAKNKYEADQLVKKIDFLHKSIFSHVGEYEVIHIDSKDVDKTTEQLLGKAFAKKPSKPPKAALNSFLVEKYSLQKDTYSEEQVSRHSISETATQTGLFDEDELDDVEQNKKSILSNIIDTATGAVNSIKETITGTEPHKLYIIVGSKNVWNDFRTINVKVENSNIGVIFDCDMKNTPYNSAFLNALLRSPVVYRADRFIQQNTNINVLSSLMGSQRMQSFFNTKKNHLDDVAIQLLKKELISESAVFERFSDLSHLPVKINEHVWDIWGETQENITLSYSRTINQIILLIERIYKRSNSNNTLLPKIREVALKILGLCSFSASYVPLTHLVHNRVVNFCKPVIYVPTNIDDDIIELVSIVDVPISDKDRELFISKDANTYNDPDFVQILSGFNSLNELNAAILIAAQTIRGAIGDDLKILNNLVSFRNQIIHSVLRKGVGTPFEKQPKLNDLVAFLLRIATDNFDNQHPLYSELKDQISHLRTQISTLIELPLFPLDYLRYELGCHQISVGEISNRQLVYSWDDSLNSWCSEQNLIPFAADMNDAIAKVRDDFNRGIFDVVIVESDLIYNLNLSAEPNTNPNIVLDSDRKRSLIFTHYHLPARNYIAAINCVNALKQVVSPEIILNISHSPSQNAMAQLMLSQLGNLKLNPTFDIKSVDLSYYLTESGRSLLHEYLSLNPRFQSHYPSLPLVNWNIYHVLSIVGMYHGQFQDSVMMDLLSLCQNHMLYLQNRRENPYDVFIVSPKAHLQKNQVILNSFHLSRRKAHQVKMREVEHFSLEYVKDNSNQYNINACFADYQEAKSKEIAQLVNILSNSGSQDENTSEFLGRSHSSLLDMYIRRYEDFALEVFGDIIVAMLQDRFQNWKYKQKKVSENLLKKAFQSNAGIKIVRSVKGIYESILTLGDIGLINLFESVISTISFLRKYQQTLVELEKQIKADINLIMLPIAAPYTDKELSDLSGVLLQVHYPTHDMSSLLSRSFKVEVMYPSKSKPTELNLNFILEEKSILNNESVLPEFSHSVAANICGYYNSITLREIISSKLESQKYSAITRFELMTDSENYASNETLSLLYEASQEDASSHKIRQMEILTGRLFEIYYMLLPRFQLSLASFTTQDGLLAHGLVIPPNLDVNLVISTIPQAVNIGQLSAVYDNLIKTNRLANLNSINLIGRSGQLIASDLRKHSVKIQLILDELQLKSLLFDLSIFKPRGTVTKQLDASNKGILNFDQGKVTYLPTHVVYEDIISQDKMKKLMIKISELNLYRTAFFDSSVREVGEIK